MPQDALCQCTPRGKWCALAGSNGDDKRNACQYALWMVRKFGLPPSIAEIEHIARSVLHQQIPPPFAQHLRGIVLSVEEFADDETLDELGIEDPFALTGVYEGLPLTERSVDQSGMVPDRIRLFRAAILDEWIAGANNEEGAGGETLEHLVAHVMVHEVGHHFGLSDADIAALEDGVE